MIIDEVELIERVSQGYWHLAQKPLDRIEKRQQNLVNQYNLVGRPNGLWYARGMKWLQATTRFDNPNFVNCCYLYEMSLKKDANILYCNGTANSIMTNFPVYWVNYDYFDMVWRDKKTGVLNLWRAKKTIQARCGKNIVEFLLKNGIVFDDSETARQNSQFYKKYDPEYFTLPRWDIIAKKYDGVMFNKWTGRSKYYWWRTLDEESGCVWNLGCVEGLKMRYAKVDKLKWHKK